MAYLTSSEKADPHLIQTRRSLVSVDRKDDLYSRKTILCVCSVLHQMLEMLKVTVDNCCFGLLSIVHCLKEKLSVKK
jgi:hypothetical protein